LNCVLVATLVDVGHQLLELRVQVRPVLRAVGRVERLHRQVAHRLQVAGDLGQRAGSSLRQRHAIAGVVGSLVQAVDL
jgi:hypothetical protein